MEEIEKKVINLKNKIDKKWLAVFFYLVFCLGVVFSLDMAKRYKVNKQDVENEYNKSMYEAYGYIKNVEEELAKLEIINTRPMVITTLSTIWSKAALAKTDIESLPLEQNNLSTTSNFLTQLSDYSYTLLKKQLTSDELVIQENYKDISYLHEQTKKLANVMLSVYNDLNANSIKWDELKKIGNAEFSNLEISSSVENIAQIGKIFQKYEGLIYDGAFSEHVTEEKPKLLNMENQTSKDEAKEYIKNLFGEENIESITEKEDVNFELELYVFDVKLKDETNTRNIYITKNDCKLYLMLYDEKASSENITINEAKKIATNFLSSLGAENMKETYYLKTENMAIINYAATQDDIILYPDLIKVKISLDTGKVCSVEAKGYIFNHEKRENLNFKYTLEEAKKKINENVKITSTNIAIIPTDSKKEVLTYEFVGMVEDKECLIYINANTLEEEKVFLIIETPDGFLTV